MIKALSVRSKARFGLVLNLSELAIASGYDRGVLAKMNLPLQSGKISLQDFQRVMRKRQDYREKLARNIVSLSDPSVPSVVKKSSVTPPVSSAPAGDDQKRAAADTFYGRSSKRAGKGASRRARQFQLQGTA